MNSCPPEHIVKIPLTEDEYDLIIRSTGRFKNDVDYSSGWDDRKNMTLYISDWGQTMGCVALYCKKEKKYDEHRETLHRKVKARNPLMEINK